MVFDVAPRNPPPLYGTPRNLSRETRGPKVAKVFRAFGQEPMPWQSSALDVACELDPNTGLYYYRTVIIIVVRQAGKTTMTRGKLAHRGISQPGATMLYTAQDRNHARHRLDKNIYQPLKASPLGAYLGRPRWQAGSEAVRFLNGSELTIDAVTKTSGHGDTLDEAHIDEAFAHHDSRIEQAVSPTMITVQGAQKWITSAAGDLDSAFLLGKRDMGRALVESGADSRTCYIEYAAPLDADPDDPETYMNTHPAIGHTIQLADVVDERINMAATPEEFERAYLGWWPKAQKAPSVIPEELWSQNFLDPELDTWEGVPMWSVDVSPDREWASVGLAARSFDPEARLFLEVIDHEMGTAWIVDRLVNLRSRFGGNRVAVDASGAADSLVEDLEGVTQEKGGPFEVVRMNAHERGAACGAFYDDAVQAKVQYLDDPVLNDAMRAAVWMKIFGGESRIFSRGRSMQDISPLYSVTIARWAFIKVTAGDYDALDSLG